MKKETKNPEEVKADKKQDKKKQEELSEEDQALKAEIEYLVEKVLGTEGSEARVRYISTLFEKIKTRSTSRTTVPKELKFLKPHYERIASEFKDCTDVKVKTSLADFLSYASITLADNYERDSIKYLQQGTRQLVLSSLGDEFLLNLAGDIAGEFEQKLSLEENTDELVELAKEIIAPLFKHGHEINATDMLIELERLDLLDPYVDSENYERISKYLVAYVDYTADTVEFEKVLERLFTLAKAHKDAMGAMRVAVKKNDRELAVEALNISTDRSIRLQLAFSLGEARMYLSPELLERVGLAGDEQFIQAMSNMLTKDYFQIFIKDLDLSVPKKPADIYKKMGEEKDSKLDSAQLNLGDSFVNAFVNMGSGKDALLIEQKEGEAPWITRVKDAGIMSTVASLGLTFLWNFEGGQDLIAEYLDLQDSWMKAGACIAVGLANSGVWNESDPAKALLFDYLESKDPAIKVGATVGLGLAYAGSNRTDLDEQLMAIINDENNGTELCANAALAMGMIHAAECHSETSESIMTSFTLFSPENLKKPMGKFFALALGINALGVQAKADGLRDALKAFDTPMANFAELIVEACAYIGSGSVLRVQEMMARASTGKEEDHEIQSMALIGATLISISEPVGSAMVLRLVQHVLQYTSGNLRRAVPIMLTIAGVVNPNAQLIDVLYKLAFEEDRELALRAILGMGLTFAGSNNSRVAELLRNLADYYSGENEKVFVIKIALGLLFAAKGLVTLSPFYSNRFLHLKPGFAGLLVACFLMLDIEELLLKGNHYLLFYLGLSVNPKMLFCLDEKLESLKIQVRVGQAVDTVGQVGKPRTLTGFQTFTSPVVVGIGDHAELATEEYVPVAGNQIEHFLVLKKNPDYVEEDKKKK